MYVRDWWVWSGTSVNNASHYINLSPRFFKKIPWNLKTHALPYELNYVTHVSVAHRAAYLPDVLNNHNFLVNSSPYCSLCLIKTQITFGNLNALTLPESYTYVHDLLTRCRKWRRQALIHELDIRRPDFVYFSFLFPSTGGQWNYKHQDNAYFRAPPNQSTSITSEQTSLKGLLTWCHFHCFFSLQEPFHLSIILQIR